MSNPIFLSLLLVVFNVQSTFSQVEWVKDLGGSKGVAVATDNLNNVYTVGGYYGTVDLDPSASIQNFTSSGYQDIFIQKFDPSGTLIWAKSFGGIGLDDPTDITIDQQGNVLITGYFGDTSDFDPGPSVFEMFSNGQHDIFILKLSPNGDFQWARSIGGPFIDRSNAITTDDLENIYVVGEFTDTVDFDPSNGVDLHITNGGIDAFLQKFDPNGNVLWTKSFGGTGIEKLNSIELNSADEIIVGGNFDGTTDFDPDVGVTIKTSVGPGMNFFVSKFSLSGAFDWVQTFGGTGWSWLLDLTIDNNDNIISTGYFANIVDLSNDSTVLFTSNGWADLYVQKLDSDGNFLYGTSLGNWAWEQGSSVTTDFDNNIYVTGFFEGIVDFDPGTGTYLLDSGSELDQDSIKSDFFILKLTETCNFLWAGETNSDEDFVESGASITRDMSGGILACGTYETECDFSLGYSPFQLSGSIGWRPFLLKLNTNIGISENPDYFEISAFPNPTSDDVSIKLPYGLNVLKINILNINGQFVQSIPVIDTQNLQISLPSESGIYILEVVSGNTIHFIKVVKK